MQQSQQARLDALRDTQRFLDGEATALAPVNRSSSRKALDEMIEEIETCGALQVQSATAALNGTKRKDELRGELRNHHMRLLVEIARAKLAHAPHNTDFRVPQQRASDTALITAATAMVDAAELTPESFAADLGDDFVVQMRTRVEEFREAVISRNHSQVTATQTRQAAKDALVTARGIVRILDCMVLRETKDAPALRVGWQAAKHVKAKGGVPQGTVREVPPALAVSLFPAAPADLVTPAAALKAAA